MARATNDILSTLHERLAENMLKSLRTSEKANALLEEYPDLPDAVRDFLELCGADNPALFTAVAKFLKDNSITAVIEDSKEMSELEARLKSKRKVQVGHLSLVESDD